MLSSIGRMLGKLLLVLVSSALAVLLSEGVLRLVLNSSDFMNAKLVSDPLLGHRIEPLTTGHDALGFRNREVPAQVDIVAIGDSFTYGVSAPRDGSWPHQLAGLLGTQVYNMGLGGYGPLQYLHLARDVARPMKPRLWVVAVYFGNDLMDAYYVAHGQPHWKDWRLSVRPSGQLTEFDRAGMAAAPEKRFAALRDWLSRHSLLYSVLRATVFQRLGAHERSQMARQSSPDVQWAWSDPAQPGVRTTFTPQHRLAAVDMENLSVNEGLQISKQALATIQAEADKQGVKLLVALIPTKERAYCAYLKQVAAPLPPSHAKLCDVESRTKSELTRSLNERKVRYVDVSAALESNIAQHVQVYPTDSDGHLQSTGYGVMARVIADAVKQAPSTP
jgi:lysophospholipase L1-like esterase